MKQKQFFLKFVVKTRVLVRAYLATEPGIILYDCFFTCILDFVVYIVYALDIVLKRD